MVDAILFDLADTLVNFCDLKVATILTEGAAGTYTHLQQMGIALPEFRHYKRAHVRAFKQRYIWSALRGKDFDFMEVMIRVLRRYSIAVPHDGHQMLAWMWYRPAIARASVEADVGPTLARLRARGLKLAIVSNTCVPAHCMDQHLDRENLLQYFPVRIYSSATLYRKPHRKIYDAALRKLGVAPRRAAFVGDRLRTDIRGARRIGMRTIWKSPVAKSAFTRRYHPDLVIRRIADLPRVLPKLETLERRPIDER